MKYWDKYFRDKEIVELSSKMTVKELEAKFGIHTRTIERVLKLAGVKAKRE